MNISAHSPEIQALIDGKTSTPQNDPLESLAVPTFTTPTPQNPDHNPKPPKTTKKRLIIIGSITALSFITIIACVYFYLVLNLDKSYMGPQIDNTQVVGSSSTPESAMKNKTLTRQELELAKTVNRSGWETYINHEYGFTYMHPPNTLSSVTKQVNSLDESVKDYKDLIISNGWVYSNKQYVDFTPLENQFELITEAGNFVEVYFERNGKVFSLHVNGLEFADQILSTFKFIPTSDEPISIDNWKTYSNQNFGYLIQYPNDKFSQIICPGNENKNFYLVQAPNQNPFDSPTCARDSSYPFELHPDSSFSDFSTHPDYNSIQEEIEIADHPATLLIIEQINPVPGPSWYMRATTTINNTPYDFIYNYNCQSNSTLSEKEQCKQEFLEILSTFQFTDK